MSEIKVNKISPRTACGTTTLGDSGDTFTIPAGVSITNSGTASGFGSTGEVSWNTTVKTGDFTAVSGEGYFVNTTSGEITVTLPSASAGSVVAVQDYNNTFDSNSCKIQAPSGVKINGGTAAGSLTLSTEGQGLTLIYVDSTVGWRSVDSTTFSDGSIVPAYITATGGTITTVDTNFKVHVFNSPGTFCVSAGGGPLAVADYVVVAGGGGGGLKRGGGGAAGGYRESHKCSTSGPYTASPLASTTSLSLSPGPYSVTVGAGGTGGVGASPICDAASTPNAQGSSSIFSTITSAGGGAGGGTGTPDGSGQDGGSGGGGFLSAPSKPAPASHAAGSGNTPPVSPPQGNPGGTASNPYSPGASGGGGGATAAGKNYNFTPTGTGVAPQNGAGGDGATTNITGSPVTRAGGGGTGSRPCGAQAPGGAGGGGRGSNNQSAPWGCNQDGEDGTANSGGGGGGSGDVNAAEGGAGGSGVVIIRYRFQA